MLDKDNQLKVREIPDTADIIAWRDGLFKFRNASIDEVMKGWKASPGHNKNLLLADAQEMGIALVQDPRTEFKTFWTLVVGSSL